MDITGSRELITRGNLDGIVSAGVFLRRFPRSPVRFVTSPASAADALGSAGSEGVYVVDISLTPRLVRAVEGCPKKVTIIDHHPSPACPDYAVIDTAVSAAGLLYRVLEGRGMDDVVALADLHEGADTALLRSALQRTGSEVLENEARVLDFAWRLNVEDDAFRLAAASCLSSGGMPSSHPVIAQRHAAMVRQDGWGRALEGVRRDLRRCGRVGVLELGGRRRSFHGFGSRALTEVARREGCRYAVMINRGETEAVVSLRAAAPGGIDLGRFIEAFTRRHGIEGGGHPASAGARIPAAATPFLLEELEALA